MAENISSINTAVTKQHIGSGSGTGIQNFSVTGIADWKTKINAASFAIITTALSIDGNHGNSGGVSRTVSINQSYNASNGTFSVNTGMSVNNYGSVAIKSQSYSVSYNVYVYY